MHSYYIGIFHENFYVIVYHADCLGRGYFGFGYWHGFKKLYSFKIHRHVKPEFRKKI